MYLFREKSAILYILVVMYHRVSFYTLFIHVPEGGSPTFRHWSGVTETVPFDDTEYGIIQITVTPKCQSTMVPGMGESSSSRKKI